MLLYWRLLKKKDPPLTRSNCAYTDFDYELETTGTLYRMLTSHRDCGTESWRVNDKTQEVNQAIILTRSCCWSMIFGHKNCQWSNFRIHSKHTLRPNKTLIEGRGRPESQAYWTFHHMYKPAMFSKMGRRVLACASVRRANLTACKIRRALRKVTVHCTRPSQSW